MLILAIDSSGRNGSVALCRGSADQCNVLSMCTLEGGTYSARLVPCISELLNHARTSKANIDAVVVVDGPGSFTGLRVGLSTAKALCEVLAKPLVTVSMLEALVLTHGQNGESIRAVLDAGRGELYAGDYVINGENAELRREYIVKQIDFLSELPGSSQVLLAKPLQADTIARIGLRKLCAGDIADQAALDANYIRRPDAELYSPPKR